MKFPIPQVVDDLHIEVKRRRELPDADQRFNEDIGFIGSRLAEMTPDEVESFEFVWTLEIARLEESTEALREQVARRKGYAFGIEPV